MTSEENKQGDKPVFAVYLDKLFFITSGIRNTKKDNAIISKAIVSEEKLLNTEE
jgi:hypothetical protein